MELKSAMITTKKETMPREMSSETRVLNKCPPKSFSIESLISRHSPPVEAKSAMPSLPAPLNFTHNFPVAAAAAAAAMYNPWIHSYLAQQHPPPAAKYPGAMEMLPAGIAKDRLTEMFADPRIAFGASDYRDKLLAQCFANNVRDKKVSDLFMSNSEYYGNGLNVPGFPMPSGCGSDQSLHAMNGDGRVVDSGEKGNSAGNSSDMMYEDRHCNRGMSHSDDVDVNEDIADDLDSDCSSEISMTMSPDAANRINGM